MWVNRAKHETELRRLHAEIDFLRGQIWAQRDSGAAMVTTVERIVGVFAGTPTPAPDPDPSLLANSLPIDPDDLVDWSDGLEMAVNRPLSSHLQPPVPQDMELQLDIEEDWDPPHV